MTNQEILKQVQYDKLWTPPRAGNLLEEPMYQSKYEFKLITQKYENFYFLASYLS